MNILDIIIIIPVLAGFIIGLFKGFVKELISLAAIVIGIVGAKYLQPYVSNFLVSAFNMKLETAQPVAYLSLFIIILLLLLLVAHLIDKLLSAMALGGLNKLLGGIFGALKYALIVSVLLNVFDALDSRFTLIEPTKKEKSFSYKPLMKLAPELWKEAKEVLMEEK